MFILLFTFIAAIHGLEITPYLPEGVTRVTTITTTAKDFDAERFQFVTETKDSNGNYDIRNKFEKTVFTIDPTITTEVIYKTKPDYVTGNPLTVGILNSHFDKDEKYFVPLYTKVPEL